MIRCLPCLMAVKHSFLLSSLGLVDEASKNRLGYPKKNR
jgi:hypothetical protein